MSTVLERTEIEFATPAGQYVENVTSAASLVDQLMTIYHGGRKGYYEFLADCGPMTYVDLANFAGSSESVARDWLDAQVALGVLVADNRPVPAWERRYRLAASRAAFLLDLEDPFSSLDEAVSIAA